MESVLGVALSKQLRYSLHRMDFDLEVVLEMRGLPKSGLVLQEFIAAKREINVLKGARHHIGDDRDSATLTMDDDGSGIAALVNNQKARDMEMDYRPNRTDTLKYMLLTNSRMFNLNKDLEKAEEASMVLGSSRTRVRLASHALPAFVFKSHMYIT